MRALVTGATGLVGNHVVRALVRRDVDVRVLIRPTSDRSVLADLPVQAVEGDLMEPSTLTEACRSTYQATKVQAERAAWEWIRRGAQITIVNPSTVIGPGDRQPSPTGRLILDFVSGRLPAYLNATLNWIDVRDVAEGHWLAATQGRVGERYLLAHENLTVGQFLAMLAQTCGLPQTPLRIAVADAFRWLTEHGSIHQGAAL